VKSIEEKKENLSKPTMEDERIMDDRIESKWNWGLCVREFILNWN